MHKTRLARPTLRDAHKFHEVGFYPFEHTDQHLSPTDHYNEIQEIEKDLKQVVRTQFPRTQNLEYAILKAHLIVEHALVQFIRSFASVAVERKAIRFTFSEKLEIAYLMGFGTGDPTLLPTIELLNRVRNQVAHSFALDRRQVDELLRINHENYKTFKPKNDRERIRGLKQICAFVSGYIFGNISASFSIHQKVRTS